MPCVCGKFFPCLRAIFCDWKIGILKMFWLNNFIQTNFPPKKTNKRFWEDRRTGVRNFYDYKSWIKLSYYINIFFCLSFHSRFLLRKTVLISFCNECYRSRQVYRSIFLFSREYLSLDSSHFWLIQFENIICFVFDLINISCKSYATGYINIFATLSAFKNNNSDK